MIDARIYGYLDDEGTQKIGGTITATGGSCGDIKAVTWDDGTTTHVADHHQGWNWDYQD